MATTSGRHTLKATRERIELEAQLARERDRGTALERRAAFLEQALRTSYAIALRPRTTPDPTDT